MEAVIKEFTRNNNGVQIVKCCASCKHCCGDKIRDDIRICSEGHGMHDNSYLCSDWTMHDRLAGIQLNGDGKIKKPAYFKWLKEQVEQLRAEDLDDRTRLAIVLNLPKRYEQIIGSRYLNI